MLKLFFVSNIKNKKNKNDPFSIKNEENSRATIFKYYGIMST